MLGYFTFTVCQDGECRIRGPMSADALRQWLGEHAEEGVPIEFATAAPMNTAYFGDKVLVIKGEIVTPEPVTVATSYKIP